MKLMRVRDADAGAFDKVPELRMGDIHAYADHATFGAAAALSAFGFSAFLTGSSLPRRCIRAFPVNSGSPEMLYDRSPFTAARSWLRRGG